MGGSAGRIGSKNPLCELSSRLPVSMSDLEGRGGGGAMLANNTRQWVDGLMRKGVWGSAETPVSRGKSRRVRLREEGKERKRRETGSNQTKRWEGRKQNNGGGAHQSGANRKAWPPEDGERQGGRGRAYRPHTPQGEPPSGFPGSGCSSLREFRRAGRMRPGSPCAPSGRRKRHGRDPGTSSRARSSQRGVGCLV